MMDISKLTRAKAERLCASTMDPEVLDLLKRHANKHVKTKAYHKHNRLLQGDYDIKVDDKPKQKRKTKSVAMLVGVATALVAGVIVEALPISEKPKRSKKKIVENE